jgi:MOSC domain-containing protein YiiM
MVRFWMDEPQMAALLVAHDGPGFYFRVLEEGCRQANLPVADRRSRVNQARLHALTTLALSVTRLTQNPDKPCLG